MAKKFTDAGIYVVGSWTALDILEKGGVDALVAQPLYDGYGYCATMLYQNRMGEEVQFDNIAEAPVIFAEDVPEYREMLKGADLYIKNMG